MITGNRNPPSGSEATMTLDDLRAQAHALNLKLSEAANLADELAVALQNYQPGPMPRPERAEVTMARYRQKPVEIEAELIDYDKPHRIPDRFRAQLCTCAELPNEWPTKAHVHTLEGPLAVRDGDILICGVNGEFYPCKPDIFAKTYDPA
jgi:hypothetical protein